MIKIKDGDTMLFVALSWSEPQWEFDHPTVVLYPAIAYSPNGDSTKKMIEDMAEELCIDKEVENEDVREEFHWRDWNIDKLKKVANTIASGGMMWKTKFICVTTAIVKFTLVEGEFSYEIIKETNFYNQFKK